MRVVLVHRPGERPEALKDFAGMKKRTGMERSISHRDIPKAGTVTLRAFDPILTPSAGSRFRSYDISPPLARANVISRPDSGNTAIYY